MNIQRVETYMKRVAESETKTFTPVGDKLKVGLDLGTAYKMCIRDSHGGSLLWIC